jgi:hypothetical protein
VAKLPECEHSDEQQADARVMGQSPAATDETDPGAHGDSTERCSRENGGAEQCRQRHPWKHSMRHGFTEKCHPAQDNPDTNDRTDERDKRAAQKGALHEVDAEGIGEPRHGSKP